MTIHTRGNVNRRRTNIESVLDLLFDPSKNQRPHRILLYGVPGIGKTTWATSADSAVVIPTEDGQRQVSGQSFPLAKDTTNFLKYVQALNEDHQFRTLVIDSLDWLEKLIWASVASDHKVESIEGIGYGKGYQFAADKWQYLLDILELININKQMTIVLIAHSQVIKHNDPTTDSYDRYAPRLHKFADAIVREWCDEVLFANYKTYTHEKDAGFNKKITKASGAGERVIYTSERPSHLAKNRLNLEYEMPLAWSELAKFLPCITKAV